ncbi:MAG TPA: hypothetical protein VK919_08850 [Solirubrobacterales bacterium]|nr:hypothetical protein [Solirubrobacterales bacterium]
MDIWEYMLQKEAEFRRFSVTPDRELHDMFKAAPDSPDGKRGRVFGDLVFPEQDAYLRVLERVTVRRGAIHRLRYSYALIVAEVHEYGWERDPTHNPAVHASTAIDHM